MWRLAWRWDNAVNALIGIESSASRASGLTNPRLREREWSSQGIRRGKSNGPYYTDEHDEGLLHVKYFITSELKYTLLP